MIQASNSKPLTYRQEKEAARIRTWRMIECMWEDGLTISEIARELGTTHCAVNQKVYVMRKAGWPIQYRRPIIQ